MARKILCVAFLLFLTAPALAIELYRFKGETIAYEKVSKDSEIIYRFPLISRGLDSSKETKHNRGAPPKPSMVQESGHTEPKSKVDESSVVFTLTQCGGGIPHRRGVRGDVPEGIDLSDDRVAKAIMEKGGRFAEEKCPTTGRKLTKSAGRMAYVKCPATNVVVELYQSSFWPIGTQGSKEKEVVAGLNFACDEFLWERGGGAYRNFASERRVEEAKARQRAEEQRAIEARGFSTICGGGDLAHTRCGELSKLQDKVREQTRGDLSNGR